MGHKSLLAILIVTCLLSPILSLPLDDQKESSDKRQESPQEQPGQAELGPPLPVEANANEPQNLPQDAPQNPPQDAPQNQPQPVDGQQQPQQEGAEEKSDLDTANTWWGGYGGWGRGLGWGGYYRRPYYYSGWGSPYYGGYGGYGYGRGYGGWGWKYWG